MATQDSLIDAIIMTNHLTAKQTLILKAAIKLFAEKGYSNTSTNEIVSEAGVSEGSLFKKFKNKRGLLNTILEPIIKNIIPSFFQEVSWQLLKEDTHSLYTIIKMMVDDRVNFVYKNIAIAKIFFSEILYAKNIKNKVTKNLPSKLVINLNQELYKLKRENILIKWPNEEIINFLAYNIIGFVLNQFILSKKDLSAVKKQKKYLINFLVSGLSPAA